MSSNLPSINRIAQIMGGDVARGEVLVLATQAKEVTLVVMPQLT